MIVRPMCYACLQDPFDFIDRVKRAAQQKQMRDLEIKQLEARELKSTMKVIEQSQRGETTCLRGEVIIALIKQRQYELAQQM